VQSSDPVVDPLEISASKTAINGFCNLYGEIEPKAFNTQ